MVFAPKAKSAALLVVNPSPADLLINAVYLVVHPTLPLRHRAHHHRHSGHNAYGGKHPAEDLDDLELVALVQPARDAADAAALDEAEEGVDEDAGNDPEDGGEDDEYLRKRRASASSASE